MPEGSGVLGGLGLRLALWTGSGQVCAQQLSGAHLQVSLSSDLQL